MANPSNMSNFGDVCQLFNMLTWSKCEWMSFIWMRLIESAASSLPSPMLASTLSEVKRKNILGNVYQSINEGRTYPAFRQMSVRDKNVIVQANIAAFAALSLTRVFTTPSLCTITDNTRASWDMGGLRHVKRDIHNGSKYCDTCKNLKK